MYIDTGIDVYVGIEVDIDIEGIGIEIGIGRGKEALKLAFKSALHFSQTT